jgi:hypothetical protein
MELIERYERLVNSACFPVNDDDLSKNFTQQELYLISRQIPRRGFPEVLIEDDPDIVADFELRRS